MKLPEAFRVRTKALLGDEWADFEQALNEKVPVSIRLNPRKIPSPPLPEKESEVEAVPWASDAYYLPSRPSFTLDPLFHAGCYYVQEASSMYLEQVVKKHVQGRVKVLDLCAAPGGKSTQLSSILPQESLLVANEVIRSRAHISAENLIKWGNPYTIVTNNDPVALGKLHRFFDVVLADVPCSGEGLFRKNPDSIGEWSLQNVQLCAERQRRIVADIWPALQPGGLLIYSTCTYNQEENEENIDWICRELNAEIAEAPRRFMPHKTKGEGFFIAGVRKSSDLSSSPKKGNVHCSQFTIHHSPYTVHNGEDFTVLSENNCFLEIPTVLLEDYILLKKQLKIISAGIDRGELKGKDFIPHHALAMSTHLDEKAFPVLDLDKETALKYLRKEALQNLPDTLPKGYVLVKYRERPLGFIKNIGTRANNLYPQEWRIRMLSGK